MLRRATDGDVDAMLAMRNQPANREVSITSHEITAAEHRDWWGRASADATRRVLMVERDGHDRPVGVVTFFDLDPDARSGAWGFYLDNESLSETGELMPAWISVMKEAVGFAFDNLGLQVLTGEVLAGNEAVRSMNRRFRFTEGEPEVRVVDGREITVYPLTLRAADRRRPRTSSTSSATQTQTQES